MAVKPSNGSGISICHDLDPWFDLLPVFQSSSPAPFLHLTSSCSIHPSSSLVWSSVPGVLLSLIQSSLLCLASEAAAAAAIDLYHVHHFGPTGFEFILPVVEDHLRMDGQLPRVNISVVCSASNCMF